MKMLSQRWQACRLPSSQNPNKRLTRAVLQMTCMKTLSTINLRPSSSRDGPSGIDRKAGRFHLLNHSPMTHGIRPALRLLAGGHPRGHYRRHIFLECIMQQCGVAWIEKSLEFGPERGRPISKDHQPTSAIATFLIKDASIP